MTQRFHPETISTNSGVANDPAFRSVAPPLYLSATYGWESPTQKPSYDYARSGNPTRVALGQALAELEEAASCSITATGMAAIDLVLCLVKPGERVIAPHDCYGGTYRLLSARAARGQFDVEFVDQTNPDALSNAFNRPASLVLVETPSNPLLRITDIETVIAHARRAGALVVADNTFLSPALQKPLTLGCEIVVHSTTKFINGHSDVVGGAVLSRDKTIGEELAWWANCTGVTGAPFDCYQTLRGLRTLFPRIERQQATTQRLVEALAAHPAIARLYYPGLEAHPGHEIAKRQQSGFGSMLSVEFAEDVDVEEFLRGLQVFTLAESLGGFESLVCVPALMTHASMTPEARKKASIADTLVRFSVGLEHAEDLMNDICQSLEAITSKQHAAHQVLPFTRKSSPADVETAPIGVLREAQHIERG